MDAGRGRAMGRFIAATALVMLVVIVKEHAVGQDPDPAPMVGRMVYVLSKEPAPRPGHVPFQANRQYPTGLIQQIDNDWLLIASAVNGKISETWVKISETGNQARYLKTLDEQVTKNPDDLFWLVRRGRANLAFNPERAVSDLNRAMQLDPTNVEVLLDRATAYRGMRSFDLAFADVNAVIGRDAKKISPAQRRLAYANRASIKESTNDLDGALSDLAEAIRIDPDDLANYAARAWIWNKKGMPEKAIAEYDELVKVNPNNIEAYYHRASALASRKQYDLAVADAEQIIRLAPKSSRGHESLANIFHAINDTQRELAELNTGITLELAPEPDARDPFRFSLSQLYRRRAALYFQQHDDERAFADFDDAVRLSPAPYLADRGNAKRERGDLDGAIADYSALVREFPSNSNALIERGRTYALKKDYERALADFKSTLAAQPSNGLALSESMKLRKATNDINGLFADCDDFIINNPKSSWAYTTRGHAHFERGDFADAMADFNAAISLDGDYYWAFFCRGVLWSKSDPSKALVDYDRTIQLRPKYALAYLNRGLVWIDKNEIENALSDFDTAIRLDPKNQLAYEKRGPLRATKGDLDNAIADFDQILKMNPKADWVYTSRGGVWFRKKDWDRAIADYDEAIRRNPNLTLAFRYRGCAWSKKHEPEKAIADFDEAIRLDPTQDVMFFLRAGERVLNFDDDQSRKLALADFSEAIRLSPNNAVYYVYRALSYSMEDADKAKADRDKAFELDPKLIEEIERGEAPDFSKYLKP